MNPGLLDWIPGLVFSVLGAAAIAHWLRERRPGQIYFALALVLLGLAAVTSLPVRLLPEPVANGAEVIGFAGSAFALLMFRSSVVPLPRSVLIAAGTGMALLSISGAVAGFQQNVEVQLVSWGLVALGFAACVAEPVARFWIVSRNLPPVQRTRARWLSAGYACILVAFALGFVPLALPSADGNVSAAIDILSLVPAAFLYGSFAPPSWMRRMLRRRAEPDVRNALTDLLAADDRHDLASRALAWAMRLVGADSGMVMSADGTVLASQVTGADRSADLRQALRDGVLATPRAYRGTYATAPLHAAGGGYGVLAVSAGRFTPFMGDDEAERLSEYAAAVAVALERVALTEELKETNAELVRANDLKTQFVADMSHELRTPLNSIIGFCELLMDGGGAGLAPADRADYLRRIHGSGAHLLSLINNMLDLSRLEAGKMTMDLSRVEPDLLVAEVVASMEAAASAKHVRIAVDTPALPTLVADENKVKRVLLNLLSNAVKFSPAGGRVEVQATEAGAGVRFTVADQGPGIDAADLPLLFERYSPVAGASADSTGLGLSLAKQLVDLHSGRIWVESALGRGSRFQFELPLRAA